MIRRFLSLVSGVGVSLLLGGCAFLPQGAPNFATLSQWIGPCLRLANAD